MYGHLRELYSHRVSNWVWRSLNVCVLRMENRMKRIKHKLIGDRRFYRRLFGIAVPMMIQMGITNFASMLDNIMVGQVGTEQMTGVAIANQLVFVYNLLVFGAVSGPGIFIAQFFGQRNHEGVRYTVRFKLISCCVITLLGIFVMGAFGSSLIQLYLHQESSGAGAASVTATLGYGLDYLHIVMVSFIPFAVVQTYAGTLKETGETLVPMKAGLISVFVNLVLNYILIYGKFGAPALGASGAAVGTVAARIVEMMIVVFWTHRHKERNPFIVGLYRGIYIPAGLVRRIFIKGIPLMLNEGMWAAGMAMLMQCYSVRGMDVVAAMNISNTLNNLFNVVFLSIGNSVAVIVGQLLGAGKMEEAKYSAYKIIFCSSMICIGIALCLAGTSFVFPKAYETTQTIRDLATRFILVLAFYMPVNAFLHATYFTIRSGGKTIITFLFDSGFVWCVSIPLAFCLSRFTMVPIWPLYFICCGVDVIKALVGFVLLVKGMWLNNLVEETA